MIEKLTPYLRANLNKKSFALQYISQNDCTQQPNDPLAEDTHKPVKGLIHKYSNRALIKVSYRCASHCRFCTRIRQIGSSEGDLSEGDIENIHRYLSDNKQINDVILSGGDPLYTPKQTEQILIKISNIEHIKIVRIGTRLPLQLPHFHKNTIYKELFETIKIISAHKAVFILLHIEHPDELTPEVIESLNVLQKFPVMLLSQTVFLKNINNSESILYELFSKLIYLSLKPYYIYHCDAVTGLESYSCNNSNEIEIMRNLRKKLSGLAISQHISDTEFGKFPIF